MDYVDYTLLAKKGLLKVKKEESNIKVDKEGYVQMDSLMGKPQIQEQQQTASNSSSSSDFGSFFDSVPANSNSLSGSSDANFNQLKLKVDDIEYKLDNIISRLVDIESRFSSS